MREIENESEDYCEGHDNLFNTHYQAEINYRKGYITHESEPRCPNERNNNYINNKLT